MRQIFFVGDVSQDEYYTADRFPNIKEKIIVHELKPMMGGSIANAASVFASLGDMPYFMTALNSGQITKNLLKGLEEMGVNVDYMVFDDAIPDSKCIIILAEDEHTIFIPTLNIQRFEISDEAYSKLINSDYVYTNFCEIRPIAYKGIDSEAILLKMRENGVKVFCDADCGELDPRDEKLLPHVDIIMLNQMGEIAMAERFGEEWKDKFFEYGLSLIIVTQAEKGCTLYEKGKEMTHINGIKVDTKDVTGAGDTFGAGFLYAMTKCNDYALCAEFANYLSARAVTGMGARYGVCNIDEIKGFIASHGGEVGKFESVLED